MWAIAIFAFGAFGLHFFRGAFGAAGICGWKWFANGGAKCPPFGLFGRAALVCARHLH